MSALKGILYGLQVLSMTSFWSVEGVVLYDIFITLNLSNPPFLISSPGIILAKYWVDQSLVWECCNLVSRSNSKCKTTPAIILSQDLQHRPGWETVPGGVVLMSVCLDRGDISQYFNQLVLAASCLCFVQLWSHCAVKFSISFPESQIHTFGLMKYFTDHHLYSVCPPRFTFHPSEHHFS